MAKKYIDADRLKAEIESLKSLEYPCDNSEQNFGFEYALDRLSDSLDSLQQEQSDAEALKREWWNKGYYEGRKNAHIPAKELGLPKAWDFQQEQSCDTCTNDKGCVTCKDGELWEGKEQPSEDLKAEEEIEKYMDIRGLIWYDDINLSDFARHFYELGRQSKESISKDLEEEYKDKDWGILQDMSIGEED